MSAPLLNAGRAAVRPRINNGRGSAAAPTVRPMGAQLKPMGTLKPRLDAAEEPEVVLRTATNKRSVSCAAAQQSAGVAVAIRDEHRTQQLVDTAQEFINAWSQAVTAGPTEEAFSKLNMLIDDSVHLEERDLGRVHVGKGINGVKEWITRLHSKYSPQGHKALLIAANDKDDEVYVLVEYRHQEKGGAGNVHNDYKIIKLEMLIDEANRRVLDVQQYGQLEPEHLRSVGGQPLPHTAYPVDRINTGKAPDPQTARAIAEKWATTRSSNAAPTSGLEAVVDTANFRLWDTYHVLPDPSGTGTGTGSQQTAAFTWQQVVDTVAASKGAFEQSFTLLDNAVSTKQNAGFTHWRAHYTPKGGEGKPFEVEGVQVDIYTPDGSKLQGAWVFRDPTDAEKIQLLRA